MRVIDEGGYYRHYKGGVYKVLCVAKHTETEDFMVVYEDKDRHCWVRPLAMFNENVLVNGSQVPRFEQIG